ncbi:MAG TPA: GNAT family N-acetyltransferase [Stellaceae bacterium]|nr:GNAT family N-acetyltransferase [Stellaceae bacterium]
MTLVLRTATATDVPTILRMVHDLATFEREPDAVHATEADLLRDGFGAEPKFHVQLAEIDGKPAGFALWYFNYSTWEGRAGIHLEDLWVAEFARGQNVGKRLVAELAKIAIGLGARRLDLNVLTWNPARNFYEKLGITDREDWRGYRISGDKLKALAAQAG